MTAEEPGGRGRDEPEASLEMGDELRDQRGAARSVVVGVGKDVMTAVTGGVEHDADDPVRMAGRILQKGDVVGLVERMQHAVDLEDSERLAKRALSKRGLDLEDFLTAMRQIQKMGPLKGVLGLLPGVDAKMLKSANVDEKRVKHFEAIVLSMTPSERRRPEILNGPRRARIARGAGRSVQEVNHLLKQFAQMKKMMAGLGKLSPR